MAQADAILLTQQQAIVNLESGLAVGLTSGHPSLPRVPVSAVLEKCEAEMSMAAFRSWRSMECWLQLNSWPAAQIILHIRLSCSPALQCAMDAKFSSAQWSALTPGDAMDAISAIMLR